MLSRPKVNVYISPPVAIAGQVLEVTCTLDAKTETPGDWISIALNGRIRTAHGYGQDRVQLQLCGLTRSGRSPTARSPA